MNGKIMKGIVASLAGMLVMACSGCGGGGGGSAPDQAAKPAPAPAAKSISIAQTGDSTTAGLMFVNGAYTVTGLPHAKLQDLLQSKFGNFVTVDGPANVGGTIQNFLRGVENYPAYTTFLASSKDAIVIADFGINDGKFYGQDEFRQYLTQFIADTKAAGKIPVLEEPLPPCKKNDDGTASPLYSGPNTLFRNPFVDTIDDVGYRENVLVIKQYDDIQANPAWCASMLSEDLAHPNASGYALRAQREADQLAPLVAQLLQK